MGIQTLNIPIQGENIQTYIVQGDTIPAISLTFDGISLTDAEIKMQLYDRVGRKVFDVENGNGITILSSSVCRIDTVLNNTFPCGNLIGDFQIKTNPDDILKTYFRLNYKILKEYTI